MKLEDATDIYVGTTQASKAYIGTTQVYPVTPYPDTVEYSATLNGGWGQNIMSDGGHYNISGSMWFSALKDSHNYTSQYTWTVSGDVTLTDTDYITGNPYSTVGGYKYTFGGGSSTMTLTATVGGRTIMTVTFN